MSTITISEKRVKTVEVKDSDGKVLGKFCYNPNDISALEGFWNVYSTIQHGTKKHEEFSKEFDKIDSSVLDGELKTAKDIEKAGEVVSFGLKGINLSKEIFDEVVEGLDNIFGVGTCDLFIKVYGKRYYDFEMLNPLIESVLPDFEQATAERKKTVGKYKREKPAQ